MLRAIGKLAYRDKPHQRLRRYLDSQYGPERSRHVIDTIRRFALSWENGANQTAEPDAAELQGWLQDLGEAGRAALPNSALKAPDVSIIIPVYNQLRYTLACIHSLLTWQSRYSFEIIVADDCSTDATPRIIPQLPFVRHVRGETNKGFIRNCNGAAREARGRYVVFLNNDTLILPDWLDELIGTLESNPAVGLAGSKLLYANGTLQEAGGLIWGNRHIWNYGRNGDPLRPEFSYTRDVDYISGASIALPADLWQALGGFDEWYDVAYAEDADLAQRVKQAGRRVVFQSLSQLIHFEGITSGTDLSQGAKAYQVANVEKLYQRWGDLFATYRPDGQCVEQERERTVTRRVLIIDYVTPTPDKDAGSLATWEFIRAFQANGYKVVFAPGITFRYCGEDTQRLQRIGVEVIYQPYFKTPNEYIKTYGALFDVVFLIRYNVATLFIDDIRTYAPQAKILLDTADLHYVRETRRLEVEGCTPAQAKKLERQKQEELSVLKRVDLSILHSTVERTILEEENLPARLYIFPYSLDPVGRSAPFSARRDIMFLGGFRHTPNADAVKFFVADIWPTVHAAIPDMQFFVVGSHPSEDILALDGKDGVVVTGFVEDLQPWFERIRLSVAPLRFGAGLKGKVAMSLAHGVPCVATSCAAEGMELDAGREILIADEAAAMARAVIDLYRDEARWLALSDAGLAYVDRYLSTQRARERIAEMITIMGVRSLAAP